MFLIGAIVVGLDRTITYSKVAFATYHLLNNPECLFVATNDDQTYPSGVKGNVPGRIEIVSCAYLFRGRRYCCYG